MSTHPPKSTQEKIHIDEVCHTVDMIIKTLWSDVLCELCEDVRKVIKPLLANNNADTVNTRPPYNRNHFEHLTYLINEVRTERHEHMFRVFELIMLTIQPHIKGDKLSPELGGSDMMLLYWRMELYKSVFCFKLNNIFDDIMSLVNPRPFCPPGLPSLANPLLPRQDRRTLNAATTTGMVHADDIASCVSKVRYAHQCKSLVWLINSIRETKHFSSTLHNQIANIIDGVPENDEKQLREAVDRIMHTIATYIDAKPDSDVSDREPLQIAYRKIQIYLSIFYSKLSQIDINIAVSIPGDEAKPLIPIQASNSIQWVDVDE